MHSFAIIPAAGHSRRMGRHKLTMPYQDSTVLGRVLAAWSSSGVSETVVVVRRDDRALQRICADAGVSMVMPMEDPPQMKDSVQHGLRFVDERFAPGQGDVWLMAPADAPRLSARVIDLLLNSVDPHRPDILVPTHGGRRGHPVLFPWSRAADVAELDADQGVNRLLQLYETRELSCQDESVLDDLDTPADYQRLKPDERRRADQRGRADV